MAAPRAPPQAAELDATAAALCARGKGLLAADESTATVGKRLASVGVANTEDNRRALRQLLFTAPDLGASVSGVVRRRAAARAARALFSLSRAAVVAPAPLTPRPRATRRARRAQIMYEETLSQRADDGRPFVEVLRAAGVLPGVKVDTGVQPLPGGAAARPWPRKRTAP